MKKLLFYPVAVLVLTAGMFVQSCSKVSDDTGLNPETRAVPAENDPVLVADILRIGGVDLSDANPLNAGIFFINDSIPFYNVVMFNKVRINERPGWNVYLGWDRGMQKVFDNPETYIRPLQEQGIKVLLTVTGYQVNGWGFANMNDNQAIGITDELVELVATYGFDGIEVEDEWTQYGANNCPMPNVNSFTVFLRMLRAKLPADKIISLKDTGHTYDLKPEAVASVDYVWNSYYSYYTAYSHVPGLPKKKWVPLLLDCNSYMDEYEIEDWVASMTEAGFSSVVFNRLTETSPLELFQTFATTAFGKGTVVTQSRETYPNQWWK